MDLKMSAMQRNVWNMLEKYNNTSIGNVSGLLNIPKSIDEMEMKRILNRLIYLNPALKLRAGISGSLYLSETVEAELITIDGSGYDEQQLENKIEELVNTPLFNYDAVLMRLVFIKLTDGNLFLGITHHLIVDGIGMQQLTAQIMEMVNNPDSELFNEDTLPDMSFIDYLSADKEADEGRVRNTYLDKLSFADTLSTIDNASLYPKRREALSVKARIYQSEIDNDIKADGYTLEHIFLAAMALYYHRITGNDLVCVGRVLINRNKKLQRTVGMFTNTLPLFVKVSEGDSFLDICERIKKQTFDMLKCSDMSVTELRDRLSSAAGLYNATLAYRPIHRLPMENGMIARQIECDSLELPLRILLDETLDRIKLTYIYQEEVFTKKEIAALNNELFNIIRSNLGADIEIAESSSPNNGAYKGAVSDNTYDGADDDYFSIFNDCLNKYPDKPLWIDGENNVITYKEAAALIAKVSYGIRECLASNGYKNEGNIIGIRLKRSYYMPLAMMAIMYSGNAFYPISIDISDKALDSIKEHAALLFTDDDIGRLINAKGAEVLKPINRANDSAAYAINTSGSTGEPKLVLISASSLNIRLNWMKTALGLNECTVLQKTRNTFDVSVWELLLPAMCGGSLYLLKDKEEMDPGIILKSIYDNSIEVIHFVPSMLSAFISYIKNQREYDLSLCSLRTIISSGESLNASLMKEVCSFFPNASLYNLYGPAECTIDVTCHKCDGRENPVPIGRPVWNTDICIMNDSLEPLPDGYIGEITIMGDLVGMGYHNNEEKTKEHFVTVNGKRAYRTGDLGYYDDNGEVIYTGRKDNEVKLRGMRINPEILEAEASAIADVVSAAAVISDNKLYLFAETKLSENELREELLKRVVPHYIPDIIHIVDAISFNANGKCDKKGLLENYRISHNDDSIIEIEDASLNDAERCLISIISNKLKLSDASIYKSAADYDLDSLTAIDIIAELMGRGYVLHYDELFYSKSFKEAAKYIKDVSAVDRAHEMLRVYPDWQELYKDYRVKENDRLIIAVPYAGMEFNIFNKLAKECTDRGYHFFACKCRAHEDESVEAVANNVYSAVKELISEKKVNITLLGCCVGSALSVELARRFEESAANVNLVLLGSMPDYYLPGDKSKQLVIWDILSKRHTSYILSLLFGKSVSFNEKEIAHLKAEAKLYINYFEILKSQGITIGCNARLLYGSNDIYTSGYQLRYRAWSEFIKGNITCKSLKRANHYMLDGYINEIMTEIGGEDVS